MDLSEFDTSLVYKANSKAAIVTQRNPVWGGGGGEEERKEKEHVGLKVTREGLCDTEQTCRGSGKTRVLMVHCIYEC